MKRILFFILAVLILVPSSVLAFEISIVYPDEDTLWVIGNLCTIKWKVSGNSSENLSAIFSLYGIIELLGPSSSHYNNSDVIAHGLHHVYHCGNNELCWNWEIPHSLNIQGSHRIRVRLFGPYEGSGISDQFTITYPSNSGGSGSGTSSHGTHLKPGAIKDLGAIAVPHGENPIEKGIKGLKFDVLSPRENYTYYHPVHFKVVIPKKSGRLFLRIGKKDPNSNSWDPDWMLWQVSEDKFIDKAAFYLWEDSLALPPSDYYFIARPQYVEHAPLGPAAADKDGIQFRVAPLSEKPHFSELAAKHIPVEKGQAGSGITLFPLHGKAIFSSGETITFTFRHTAPAKGFQYEFQYKVNGRWTAARTPRILRTMTSKNGTGAITTLHVQLAIPGDYRWRCRSGNGPWSRWQTFSIKGKPFPTRALHPSKGGMNKRPSGAGGGLHNRRPEKVMVRAGESHGALKITPPVITSLKRGQTFTAPARLKLASRYASGQKITYELQKRDKSGRFRTLRTSASGDFGNLKPGVYRVRARYTEKGLPEAKWQEFTVRAKPALRKLPAPTSDKKPARMHVSGIK